ncbi:MAG: hypothetical protein R3A44_40040 [Caldilineaceae bacterium]
MTTFLFWNLNQKALQESIYRIADVHEVEVIVLAECTVDPAIILTSLNRHGPDYHYAPSPGCTRIQVFTRFPSEFMPVIVESDRATMRRLKTPTMSESVIIGALHFPSKTYMNDFDQLGASPNFVDLVLQAEEQEGHNRTILMGDFNMNPFDMGMVYANGFNAVMSRTIASQRQRTVQGRSYRFFYNPMWGLLGDSSRGPAGTYFYQPSNFSSIYWHTFDQVLIRPELLEVFEHQKLEILDFDGEESLVDESGKPDKSKTSDHLPLIFELNL